MFADGIAAFTAGAHQQTVEGLFHRDRFTEMCIRDSALVNEPKLLILDEPTSALDEKNASHFYRLLKKINAEKRITVLMVTHDLKRASSYADDIWVLEDGRVKQEAGKGDGQA